ncbi:PolC-type DNA polymerase III [Abyssicoccus albus]
MMSQNSVSFDKLLDHINFNPEDPIVQQGGHSIEALKIHKVKELYEFSFIFNSPWAIDTLIQFEQKLNEAFSPIHVKLHITYTNMDVEHIIPYVIESLSRVENHHHIKSQICRDFIEYIDNKIMLKLKDEMMVNIANDKLIPLLKNELRNLGFGQFNIQFEVEQHDTQRHSVVEQSNQLQVNDNMEEQNINQFENEIISEESIASDGHMYESIMEEIRQEDENIVQTSIEKQKENKQKAESHSEASYDECHIGKEIHHEEIVSMANIIEEERKIAVEGMIFDVEIRQLKSNRSLIQLKVTDFSDSILIKMFENNKDQLKHLQALSKGDWIRVSGKVMYDEFIRNLAMTAQSIHSVNKKPKQDTHPDKRIEFHLHSNMSQMDATTSISDYVKRAKEWGHQALTLTDHDNLQSYPEAYSASLDHDIKINFGLEAMLIDDGKTICYKPRHIELKDATYVVFDVETTGLSAKYDKIIELAAVKVHNGEIIDKFERFSDPHEPLSDTTINLTGITDDMVQGAPEIEEVLQDFKEFSEGCIFVAHNAEFDMGFIDSWYVKSGMDKTTHPVIDTLELSRRMNTSMSKHGLNVLAKHYNVELTQHHRAIYDAEATGYILIKMLDELYALNIFYHDKIDQTLQNKEAYKRAFPSHVQIIVQNQTGLKNLFKLISRASTEYFFKTPRIPKRLLNEHREGLLIGSGCKEGEVFTAMMQKSYDEAKEIAAYYDYFEIQPLTMYQPLIDRELVDSKDRIIEILKNIVALGEDMNKIVIATGNVHYLDPTDSKAREILIKSNPGNPIGRQTLPSAHFRTTDEMLDEFYYLDEQTRLNVVIHNTHQLNDMIDVVKPIKDKLYTPNFENSDERITKLSYDMAKSIYGDDLPEVITSRLDKELKSIIDNGFSDIYLISRDLVVKSLNDGYLVGSRGSVGSSFVATMTEITEVNPLPPHYVCSECCHHEFFTDGRVSSGFDLPNKKCPKCGTDYTKNGQDIPFETFLGFKGDKVPDIDLNFSGDYQPTAHLYTRELFGEDKVYRAGTIGTVAEKTAFGFVKGYFNDQGVQKRNVEIDRLVAGCTGVRRTTGQHPGGIIVVPEDMDIFDFTPIQYPANDTKSKWMTTHFDFHSIDNNLLKLDILGHDDPTMIRMLQDLSGIDPKTIPTDDEDTMSIFSGPDILGVSEDDILCKTGTLGVPEFGTGFVRQMLEETKPTKFSELVQISGLSHGTDVWLGNAQELIRSGTCDISEVIGCRDDIMVYLMYAGLEPSVAFNIMEKVRKGKGVSEEFEEEMKSHDVPKWYIESCKKIQYMFPKAHAAAYVLMAVRIAYFKVHYPHYYYASYFSVRASDFDLMMMTKPKGQIKQFIQSQYEMFNDLTKKDKDLLTVLELVNEMAHRNITMDIIDIDKSDAKDFIIDGDKLIPPFVAIPGLGDNVAKRIVEERANGPFSSKEDIHKRCGVSNKAIEYMTELGSLNELPDTDQLSIFDL